MGQSTDAILFYGYCWEESSRPWEIDSNDDSPDAFRTRHSPRRQDWEARYARTKGCLPPSTPFPARLVTPTRENGWNSTPTDYSAEEQAIVDQHMAYWEAKRKLVEAAMCCVNTHCSSECPMPYVAVKASQTTSWRGHMKEITSLAVDPTWDAALATFCAAMGIKTDGKKAAWWLVSYWSL